MPVGSIGGGDENPSGFPGNGEGETAYEQSFDGRIVRLGNGFVLYGCPWIKGDEWDEVKVMWDAKGGSNEQSSG